MFNQDFIEFVEGFDANKFSVIYKIGVHEIFRSAMNFKLIRSQLFPLLFTGLI